MRKSTDLSHISSEDWMLLSYNKNIIDCIYSDFYSKTYPILISYFNIYHSDLTWNSLLISLHIVYGWMPTIPQLRSIIDWSEPQKYSLLKSLYQIIKFKKVTDTQFDFLKSFANNSAVGASKLLHFYVPDKFPIWDSRVAEAFYYPNKVSYYQVNKTENWLKYTESLKAWIKNSEVKKRCSELRRGAVFLKDVSDIRMVELVLFHETKSKKMMIK